MLTITLVSFRDTFDMILIIIPLLAFITRVGRKDLAKYIYYGCLAGTAISALLGGFLFTGISDLKGFSHNVFQGSMSFFLCALIVYGIIWIGKNKGNFNPDVESKLKFETTGVSLFILSFLTIFREFLELILFSLPLYDLGAIRILCGLGLGILITAVISLILYRTSIKLNINYIFSVTTLILVYAGASMFGEGLVSFFPQYGEGIEKAGMLIFGVPMLYLFLKNEIKKYTKK